MKVYQISLLLISIFFFHAALPVRGALINNWACVYYKIPVERLISTDADLLVIDPDSYSQKEVQQIKAAGIKVIAYLSVGEAESYRTFFSEVERASLIISENPNWPGNFPVKYWKKAWEKMLKVYAKQIMSKGFDGLFFDVVDGWEALETKELKQTRYRQMVDLLTKLCDFARSIEPQALMIVQNSHRLVFSESLDKRIDGINQEGLYKSWLHAEIAPDWQQSKIKELKQLRRLGKFVTLLEYTREKYEMLIIKIKASRHGFVPYFSVKELDKLFRPGK